MCEGSKVGKRLPFTGSGSRTYVRPSMKAPLHPLGLTRTFEKANGLIESMSGGCSTQEVHNSCLRCLQCFKGASCSRAARQEDELLAAGVQESRNASMAFLRQMPLHGDKCMPFSKHKHYREPEVWDPRKRLGTKSEVLCSKGSPDFVEILQDDSESSLSSIRGCVRQSMARLGQIVRGERKGFP